MSHSILILGIGNLLWADEGFGVRCVEALDAGWSFDDDVCLLDGGTQGLYLLPYVEQARKMLVFDAIDWGLPPGTLQLIEGAEVPRFMGAKKMSLHQTGFQEVLACAELLGRCPELALVGVQPVELDDYGGSLREPVRAQIAPALELALQRLAVWGVQGRPRMNAAEGRSDHALALDRYESGRPDESEAWRHGDMRFRPQ
nr:HyaD/HybD family hydrogenase maturation endopeptidase [Sinimarinibacterium sp. CAU 1509]